MTHDEERACCDTFGEKGRTAMEKYESRLAEIAEKELELIELQNVRQMLCDALEKAQQLLADDGSPSFPERSGLKARLTSLPHEIVLAEQCIGLIQQVIEKTHALAELEKQEATSRLILH